MISPIFNTFSFSDAYASFKPLTQHSPICLATTAACDVIPPLIVNIPFAFFIPSISSGDVSSLTKIESSSFKSLELKYILPTPAPGDAAKPFPIGVFVFKSSSSNDLWSNCESVLASTDKRASSFVIKPSFTRSTAILTAAFAVLFPFLVWSIYNLPSSIVNSISCISL